MEFQLRKWKKEDVESVAILANNKKIAKNLRNTFPSPYTYEDAEWFVNDCIQKGEDHQLLYAIVAKDKVIGSIGIFLKDDVYEKSGELGYWLAEEYWGNGIVSQAAKRICKEAFEKYDIVRIYAEPFEYNTGSRRALEKAGFTYEGTMRNGVYKEGQIYSYCMYSILRDEVYDT